MKQPKNGGGGVFAGLKGLKWFSTEETLLHSGATEGLALSEALSNGNFPKTKPTESLAHSEALSNGKTFNSKENLHPVSNSEPRPPNSELF